MREGLSENISQYLADALRLFGRVGRMRCQIYESHYQKSGNACIQLGHAENRLKKPKQSFVFEFSALNNFLVRVNYT